MHKAFGGLFSLKKIKKIDKKTLDIIICIRYNAVCVLGRQEKVNIIGVWLSLARVPGLGPGGRRFESCHPDLFPKNKIYESVAQLDRASAF